MNDDHGYAVLAPPRIYLIRMSVFVVLAGFIVAVLFGRIGEAFLTNPGLNGLIAAVLAVGVGHAFRLVWRLFPEARWVNTFRLADPGLGQARRPRLLGPVAMLLKDRQGRMVLTPQSLRSLLDSLASRLDESRDISRYLIGLLVFLGLIGTFWGLLQTIGSVGRIIHALDVTTGESAVLFEQLKSGLEAPLQGMGTAFSSSLFGLAGSLVLGFLDLQAGQAQNRFYTEVEDWLSSATDIEAAEGAVGGLATLSRIQAGLDGLHNSLERLNTTLERAHAQTDDSGQTL